MTDITLRRGTEPGLQIRCYKTSLCGVESRKLKVYKVEPGNKVNHVDRVKQAEQVWFDRLTNQVEQVEHVRRVYIHERR